MKYTGDIKQMKEFTIAKDVMYNFVLAIFITLALAVISVWIFNLRLDIVKSDSMSPKFYQHDIVVLRSYDDYDVGDIIEFRRGSTNVTHRVVEKTGAGSSAIYITRGDANPDNSTETVKASEINGKVIGLFEDGEHVYNFIKSNYFLLLDIVLGVWVLTSTISSEIEIRKHNIAKAE